MRVVWIAVACQLACVTNLERKVGPTLATVDHESPYLKVHMRDGGLYVLADWTVVEAQREVVGRGDKLGPDRKPLGPSGEQVIRLDDVALFESNTTHLSPSVAAMAIITGASVALTVACAINPKACFGSCPTFYAPGEDGKPVLQAEGFSDAIAPSLETHDIDALWRTHAHGGPFALTMTNEAYETHVVKQANLLVVPRPPGGRVLSTGEELWLATAIAPPLRCEAAEGSCVDQLRAVDGRERTSLTDPNDLATRETIDLGFAPASGRSGVASGRSGVAIATRQTLVTTFLLYQGLAYLGDSVGEWIAALERGDLGARLGGRKLQRLIGGIEVQVERDGEWVTVGEVYETGPLATDVHLVVLPEGEHGEHLRLRLPQGGWRIDAVALAQLERRVTPIVLAPARIRGELGPDYAAGRRAATGFPIVTMPGDRYRLDYELPPGGDYELFLDSRGYYFEWMRSEWLHERDPIAALRMLVDPAHALRELAPAFKRLEPSAEQLFWRSRYARP